MTNIRITTGDTQTVPSGQLDSGDPAQLGGELQLGGTLAITDEQPLRARGSATGDGQQVVVTTVGAGETLTVEAGETFNTTILDVDEDGTVDVDDNGTLNVGVTFDGATLSTIVPIIRQSNRTLDADSDQ